MTPQQRYTIETRRAFVRDNYTTMSLSEIASELGVPYSQVKSDRAAMKLAKGTAGRGGAISKAAQKRGKWTDEKIVQLCALYPDTSNRDIAIALGLQESTVRNKAMQMRLRRSSKYLAVVKDASQRRNKINQSSYIAAPAACAPGDKYRITYPDGLPWRAQHLRQDWTPAPMTYRGQQQMVSP